MIGVRPMRPIRLSVAALAVALGLLAVAASAQAASYTAYHPDGSWVTVSDGHKIAVCDNHQDGHKTYARIWEWYSPDYWITEYDSYGRNSAGQFCHHEAVAGWGIHRFAV